jgi:hypothetical protein
MDREPLYLSQRLHGARPQRPRGGVIIPPHALHMHIQARHRVAVQLPTGAGVVEAPHQARLLLHTQHLHGQKKTSIDAPAC